MTPWRSRTALAALLVVVGLTTAPAQDFRTFETLTIDNTAAGIGLAAATRGGGTTGIPQMNRCFGVLETASVRYRSDGTAPTATVGVLVSVGRSVSLEGAPTLRRVRFIRTGSTSGTLQLECQP